MRQPSPSCPSRIRDRSGSGDGNHAEGCPAVFVPPDVILKPGTWFPHHPAFAESRSYVGDIRLIGKAEQSHFGSCYMVGFSPGLADHQRTVRAGTGTRGFKIAENLFMLAMISVDLDNIDRRRITVFDQQAGQLRRPVGQSPNQNRRW